MKLTRKGIDQIIAYEVSSKLVYNRNLQRPIYPGGPSGVTIGIGYDLGHNSIAQIEKDWAGVLDADTVRKLKSCSELRGYAASQKLKEVKDLVVPYEAAVKVYEAKTIPRYCRMTKEAYPEIDNLPPAAQSAILSLVFNRGNLLDDSDKRREMVNIKPLIAAGDLTGIAHELRSMKRLWEGKANMAGLVIRREKEARMVENATWDEPDIIEVHV